VRVANILVATLWDHRMSIALAVALVVVFLALRFFFKVSRWIIRLAFLCIAAAILAYHFMSAPK